MWASFLMTPRRRHIFSSKPFLYAACLVSAKRNADRKQPRFPGILSDSHEVNRSSGSAFPEIILLYFNGKMPTEGCSPLWAFYIFYDLYWWALCPLIPLRLPFPICFSHPSCYRSSKRLHNALCSSTLRHKCTYLPGSFRKSHRSLSFRFWMIWSWNQYCRLPLPRLTLETILRLLLLLCFSLCCSPLYMFRRFLPLPP